MEIIDFIQIVLLLWIIERISIERSRYKLAIDFREKGYWAIWIYHKAINDTRWMKSGGRRLIHFDNYIIPKLG